MRSPRFGAYGLQVLAWEQQMDYQLASGVLVLRPGVTKILEYCQLHSRKLTLETHKGPYKDYSPSKIVVSMLVWGSVGTRIQYDCGVEACHFTEKQLRPA